MAEREVYIFLSPRLGQGCGFESCQAYTFMSRETKLLKEFTKIQRLIWNPLLIEDKDVERWINSRNEEIKYLTGFYNDARKIFPHHDLTFKYSYQERTQHQPLDGVIGLYDHPFAVDILSKFCGMDHPDGKLGDPFRHKVEYWWPQHQGKPMIPLAVLKLPANYSAVAGLTSQGERHHRWSPYYGHMRELNYTDFNDEGKYGAGSYDNYMLIFTAPMADFSRQQPSCYCVRYSEMKKENVQSINEFMKKHHPEDAKKVEEQENKHKEVFESCKIKLAEFIRKETWSAFIDQEERDGVYINPPKHELTTGIIQIEPDNVHLYFGEYGSETYNLFKNPIWEELEDKEEYDYDYPSSGTVGYQQLSKDIRFSNSKEVCAVFGQPRSQQEAWRPIASNRHPYPHAMIPILNFNDDGADMTYQYYADCFNLDYLSMIKGCGIVEASCT